MGPVLSVLPLLAALADLTQARRPVFTQPALTAALAETRSSNSAAQELAGSLAVAYRGRTFASLGEASKVLSLSNMSQLAGCICLGQEFGPENALGPRPGTCSCLNNAAHEPCGAPRLARRPASLAPGKWTEPGAPVDEVMDLCGWSTYYLNRFLWNRPFSVARYNDGEWLAMELGSSQSGSSVCPGNIDGLPCGAAFVRRLRQTLDNPALLESTWPASNTEGVTDLYSKDFIFQSSWDFLRHDGGSKQQRAGDVWNFKQQFWLIDIIHGLVRQEPADLTAWMLVLGDRRRFKVTVVGPKWLRSMQGRIPFEDFVEIPPEMSGKEQELATVDLLERELGRRLEEGGGPVSQVFLLSASMMSNVVIADLYPRARAANAFLIDIGSGFDPLMNDNRINRRTGTEAQELYRSPKETEVQRLVKLLGQVRAEYEKNQWHLPPGFTESAEGARALIQRWVQ